MDPLRRPAEGDLYGNSIIDRHCSWMKIGEGVVLNQLHPHVLPFVP